MLFHCLDGGGNEKMIKLAGYDLLTDFIDRQLCIT